MNLLKRFGWRVLVAMLGNSILFWWMIGVISTESLLSLTAVVMANVFNIQEKKQEETKPNGEII